MEFMPLQVRFWISSDSMEINNPISILSIFFPKCCVTFFSVAGISGNKEKGCNSLVLAGGYKDDKDTGYEFTYTGKLI